MPDNIAQRLKEITVDINSVKMPEKVDATKLAGALPQPTVDLKAGTSTYKVNIKMGPQEIPMDLKQSIVEKDGNWVITQKATSPMGTVKDVTTIKKGTLAPLAKEIDCLLYTSPSPRDKRQSRMPSSA